MFENILKTLLKVCEYNKNNQGSYDDAFFNQLRFRFCWLSYQNSSSMLLPQCKMSLRRRKTHDISSFSDLFSIAPSSTPRPWCVNSPATGQPPTSWDS